MFINLVPIAQELQGKRNLEVDYIFLQGIRLILCDCERMRGKEWETSVQDFTRLLIKYISR